MKIETLEGCRIAVVECLLKEWTPPILENLGETEDTQVGLATNDDGPSFNSNAS